MSAQRFLRAGAISCCLALLAAIVTVTSADAATPSPTAAARATFFGAENITSSGQVRSDRVIVSWFGVASVAMAIDGKVVLLDTYINNDVSCDPGTAPPPASSRYVPTDVEQLVALRPELLFIGHGHEDHACRTGEIAARTGALVVGLPEHCDAARAEIVGTAWQGRKIGCIAAVAEVSRPGDARTFRPLGSRIEVTAVRHLHSGLAALSVGQEDGNASVLYRFALGKFSLTWFDTAGPVRDQTPAVLTRLRSLPPTDVALGSILGLGVVQQGVRDPVDYVEALRAGTLYPLHHDFTRGLLTSSIIRGPLLSQLKGRAGPATQLRWLQDPADYLKPIVLNQA